MSNEDPYSQTMRIYIGDDDEIAFVDNFAEDEDITDGTLSVIDVQDDSVEHIELWATSQSIQHMSFKSGF